MKVHPLQIAWLSLSVLGFIGGFVFDPTPPRPVVTRAGYRVLEADFHAHTTYSDGSLSPIGLVRQAERRGLDVIGITEHNTVLAAKIGRAYSHIAKPNGPIVVVGEEVTTARFHVIALGLDSTVTADQPVSAVIRDIHQQNGIAVAAHPVEHYWPELLPVRASLDASEVMHPIAYSSARGDWRWSDTIKFYEEATPKPDQDTPATSPSSSRPVLTAIGSSDYHWGSVLGLCRTLVFVKEPANEASVLDALHEGRTVVIANHEDPPRYFGDPALIASLKSEPYEQRSSDYRYHGEGMGDRILRSLGFLGLVGALAFGRAKKRVTAQQK